MKVYKHGGNYNMQKGHLALVNNFTNVSNQGLPSISHQNFGYM